MCLVLCDHERSAWGIPVGSTSERCCRPRQFSSLCSSLTATAHPYKTPKHLDFPGCTGQLAIEDDSLHSADFPALVVKASGLAAGKGVTVASSREDACGAVRQIMQVSLWKNVVF